MPPRPPRPVSFDRIARPYRMLEYATFLAALERCRFAFISELSSSRRALIYGDGDGRFLARLLAAHPQITADAVDSSAAMLALARERVCRLGAGSPSRVRFHHADALAYQPQGTCDLVVSHFFLDCLSEEQIDTLLLRMTPHLAPGTRWLISEFAIPQGRVAGLPARLIISGLYQAFGLLTGLPVRRLPEYAPLLRQGGFSLERERSWLGGLLRSELWRRAEG